MIDRSIKDPSPLGLESVDTSLAFYFGQWLQRMSSTSSAEENGLANKMGLLFAKIVLLIHI